MGWLDDYVDRKDCLILGAFTVAMIGAVLICLSGCIAVLADKVEMRDPKQPYSTAAPIAPSDQRFDGSESRPDCEKER